MDLRQLRYFIGIVEAGSVTGAAERLHVAQSALSQHVQSLESQLGVQLLLRHRTGIRPTAAGLKLYDHARQILGHVKRAENDIRAENARAAGAVTIGIPPAVGRVLNGALLKAAKEALPHVSLEIVEVPPTHVLDWLDTNLIKLGIFYELGPPHRESIELATEDFYLVSGRNEPRAEMGVTIEQLRNFPLIMPTCAHNPRHCIVTYAEARGIALQVESRVDSLATILDLTINQPGRSVLGPSAFLPEWLAGKIFAYPLHPTVSRTVRLAGGSGLSGNIAAQAVEALVIDMAAALQADGSWPMRLPQSKGQLH